MSARTIRRAAQRQAGKLALKSQSAPAPGTARLESANLETARLETARLDTAFLETVWLGQGPGEEPDDEPSTHPRVLANRANALKSTGPRSFDGKAKVALNAVKTGLTGCTVLLPSDDAAAYQAYLREYEQAFQPSGVRERDLVQSIADTAWRLRRIPAFEIALFTQGRIEFAELFDQHDASLRASMIEFHTLVVYEKRLRNLHLQETRLQRRRERETAELLKLQEARHAREALAKAETAAKPEITADARAATNGFEFSLREIEQYRDGVSPTHSPAGTYRAA